ncbi:galactose-1-phosphate uridylyltransferase [Fictibacillus macauensis ZFHKF-1]|uniref:Galactose-1-phosphate uridylyltransferase n=1 Tax=Fictibacillus macauensis ZFHKF-1 TaxID=1196324 RepID=I8UJS0_9BACL|nr:DUF4931 domain-containing protein [Fictibacillus macauensis]EIT87125.1 galactose-1-phosphate uridylyltransferase [Fictibacillus macauensis ZFHKF-1]
MQTHLLFNMQMGTQKPESIRNTETKCPFCEVESLRNIIDQKGEIIWLENKYPVLSDAYQTVLIETSECFSELSNYESHHLYTLLSFGLEAWESLLQQKKYASVLFFKNHGPYSGGTLRHPHMQIIGLKKADYREHLAPYHFEGITIAEEDGIVLNLSTKPKMGFYEWNIVMSDRSKEKELAHYIQFTVRYLLNGFNKKCNSYNLFFYQLDGVIAAKIIPRFATSPLFVGYSLPQVANNIGEIAEDMKMIFLSKDKR